MHTHIHQMAIFATIVYIATFSVIVVMRQTQELDMKTEKLSLDDILLDELNPRLDGASSQRDILQSLLDDENGKAAEKIAVMADSIVRLGLSPIDNILVTPAPKGTKGYVTLEGNRRAAALKILSNPTLLTGLALPKRVRQKLEMLAGKFDRESVEPINCPVAKNREEAKHWIELKHTGENGGEGIVGWDGVATARFRGEGDNTGLKVLEFVRNFGDLTPAQREKLGRGFPITTLQRLLDTPDVRKLLGLSGAKGQLHSSILAAELIKPLRKIVLDLDPVVRRCLLIEAWKCDSS